MTSGFDRNLLPPVDSYYRLQLPGLKVKSGDWSQTRCCFHEEKHASLSVNLISGAYKCFACGAAGGDIIAFHRARYQMTFVEAAKDLGAWRN